MVTPGDVLGKATEVKAGNGAYVAKHNGLVYASLTGLLRTLSPPPDSPDQRPTVEVTGHKAHGAVPESGSVVIARVTKVMARMASADIMCIGPKSVKEKFTGIIRLDFASIKLKDPRIIYLNRQQDVRATEIDKVDMHSSFRPGDIVRALVLSLGDARAYFLSTAKNELGVLSAESTAGGTMIPISWTEMQCPLTGQIEQRKVAKDCFDLPSDYFAKLPGDLRLDLNDAAFDLSNGPVLDECGQELGETLLNLSRAWEVADTSTSCTLANKLLALESSLTDSARSGKDKSISTFGKRLISAGSRFQSMGQYGQGELQKIAKAMITTGKLLSASSVPTATNAQPKQETRMLKVEVTPAKAYIGTVIGFGFGILSWELAQGIQSIPESSLQYANDNALLLAKSLRVALIATFYSSTILSAFTVVGLFLLGRRLASKEK
ncbi:hypothetical protein JRO89_XS04G0148000 [Xanthoceras sorbifolium]|uniref:Exosome complex component CSL4 n=1 Tax=Xanthoceras sorbifolium TaxID=99658 RepID=A0ABQ8I623_9ROSI|nr:hypothetical protein JRO89_XS04G0148000 [Xanthoceras sorbifolium]